MRTYAVAQHFFFTTKHTNLLPFYRFPFDWRTPLGYVVAVAFEFISFFGLISNVTPSACFALGSCIWSNHVFVTQIIPNVYNLNVMSTGRRDFRAIKKLFNDIVQDYADIKEFSAPHAIDS